MIDVKDLRKSFGKRESVLNVPYLLLTNGRTHYFCRIDAEAHRYLLLENFPTYAQLTENTQ